MIVACFRGLLYSFMVINDYKENTAFFVQALLFWGIHWPRIIDNPILFFIAIPLFTLSVTFIIKKYKMLYLSIMVHTLLNVFLTVLISVINRYLI